MKTKLDKDTNNYIKDTFLSISPDSEVKTNHLNCPAGTDSRSRLYVRKTEDGRKLLAHCFNCGGSSVISTGTWLSGDVVTPEERHKATLRNMTISHHEGLIKASGQSIALSFGGLTPHKYFQDPSSRSAMESYESFGCKLVLLPSPAANPHLPCYRIYVPRDNGVQYCDYPKPPGGWNMVLKDDSGRILIYRPDPAKGVVDDKPVAVLCEDAYSAMKVCISGHIGIALCGTSLSMEEAYKLSLLFDRFLVWFDNDSNPVRALAQFTAHRLNLYAEENVKLEGILNDPKLYSSEEVCINIRNHYK